MIVYPIGILVMGKELKTVPPKRETAAAQLATEELGELPWLTNQRQVYHQVEPFAYNVIRFAATGTLVRFAVSKNSVLRVDTIHAFGPGLIEEVLAAGEILYMKQSHTEDGKLFFCPHRVIEESRHLIVSVRCLPELFMLEGNDVEQSEDEPAETMRATVVHDSSQCPECSEFAKRAGLEP